MKSWVISATIVLVATLVVAEVVHDGSDDWGVRPHPAIVNPATGQDPDWTISLRGTWEFSPHQSFKPERNNHKVKFFHLRDDWPDVRPIKVPGCWEAQGVGTNAMSDCWDVKWDHNAKRIRHFHSGDGWYRKDVAIPDAWRGRRIWLKIGGVRSLGWFWVNGKQVALNRKYCGTYKYEITEFVKPGEKARVVVQVNNAMPSRKGLMAAMNRWGGLYRDVEIEATPATFIDDAWVRGDLDRREAELHVTIGGRDIGRTACPQAAERRVNDNAPCQIRFTVDGKTADAAVAADGEAVVRLPLPELRPWSPERPNLYTGTVELVENGQVVHARRERFGVRKFEVRGECLYLNNERFFVRGFGDDHVYPLTGVSPADREYHLAHLRLAREAGFNYVRLHTHCEVPEYFEAADEAGIIVQAELPYNADVCCEHFEFDPVRDARELYLNYRRHPSFAVYSMGNEGSFGKDLDARLHKLIKAWDSDRLKINQDSQVEWVNPPESADFMGGPISAWPRGSFNPGRPFVCHEYLNLGIKADSRLEPLFTGIWEPPFPRSERAAWLARFGLDHAWGDRLQDAQHVLQRHYQKEGIESARSDPYCDGYCFWTLVDVVVPLDVGVSGQGWLTPFWTPKTFGMLPMEFAVFNSPACLIADLPGTNRVHVSGERMDIDVALANFEGGIRGGPLRLSWRIEVSGVSIATGGETVLEIPDGDMRRIARLGMVAPSVKRPCRAKLTLSLGNTANSYDLWLFPRRRRCLARDVAVADELFASLSARYEGLLHEIDLDFASVAVVVGGSVFEETALRKGKKVVSISGWRGPTNVTLGWWGMGGQVGTAFLSHPCFGDFPHDGFLTPLWFRILKHGRRLPDASIRTADLVGVGEGGGACYAYVVENKGNVRIYGVDVVSDTPEGASLLDNIVDWAKGGSRK